MANRYFATTPRGLEGALEKELITFGAQNLDPRVAGVAFEGGLSIAYRACLWSRVASRILLNLHVYEAATPEALYEGARNFPWEEHFSSDETIAVTFVTTRSAITHTNFGALKVKDAVVDRFRDLTGVRPSVDRQNPDIHLHVHVLDNYATLSLNLAGESLHRRHWRLSTGPATLKENLAAGILVMAGWPVRSRNGETMVDPMCGTGTLPVEAALMSLDVAPGLGRERFGFEKWKGHAPESWRPLIREAKKRDQRGKERTPSIWGSIPIPAPSPPHGKTPAGQGWTT